MATAPSTTRIQLVPGAENTIGFQPESYDVDSIGAGQVPDGSAVPGIPLMVSYQDGMVTLDWDASCSSGDIDFDVYEGAIGLFDRHLGILCGTGGLTTATLTQLPIDTYYLVVATDGLSDGSYGVDGVGAERPVGWATCRPQFILSCP